MTVSTLDAVQINDAIGSLFAHGKTAVTVQQVAAMLGALDSSGRIRGCDHHAIWDCLDGRADLDRCLDDDGRHYRWEVVT